MTRAETDLLTTVEAAVYLGGLYHGTLAMWRVQGRGPRYVRLGRAIRYRVRDLDDYLKSCVVEPDRTTNCVA